MNRFIVLTADVAEELALGQKLLKAAPQTMLDLFIRVVICVVVFLVGSRIINLVRKLTSNALKGRMPVRKPSSSWIPH